MRKILCIAVLALSVAACNSRDSIRGEDQVCQFDLEKNTKTCNLTQSERREAVEGRQKAYNNNMKMIDGQPYQMGNDGAYRPVN